LPELLVDLEAVRQNSAVVAGLLERHGVKLIGVTKGCGGDTRVAAAMLEGGAVALADTRDEHLRRLRQALPHAELHRIHLPPLVGDFEAVDVCYVSSLATAARAAENGTPLRPRSIMVQVETGDLREGVPAEGLVPLLRTIGSDRRVRVIGLSTNYACFAGEPAGIRASVEALAAAVRAVRAAGFDVPRVSGGNSSLLAPVMEGVGLPAEVTEVRCGEALLLGREALRYHPIPGCSPDAVRLRAQVLEGYTKTAPEGPGHRLVLDLGHQDVGSGGVVFRVPGLREIGRSADYMIVGVEADAPRPSPGDTLEASLDYTAMTTAWTSPFVEVRID
jgi:predicted amino acid racemase